jgi:diguanylate cyclase (GGDEF)-like protein
VAILAIAAAVWGVGKVQSSADDSSTHAINAGDRMLIAMLDQETGLRGYINTRDARFLEPYRTGRTHLETAIADEQRYARGRKDKPRIAAQISIARQWQRLAETEIAAVLAGKRARSGDALRRKAVMDRFRIANASFLGAKQADRERDRRTATIVALAAVLLLGAAFGTISWLVFERPARRDALRRRRLGGFSDALQVSRTEREAFDVLKRHLEGWLTRARAVVMIRNASHNRLEAATTVDATPILAKQLENAAPENCLAVRLAKPFARQPGDDGLLVCEICGQLPEASTCVPTIVGGEVIGAVVVQTPQPLGGHAIEDLDTSVTTAGPVIANLRNLAIAERRAATDALTGLANHRSVGDTLNRMVAQASRTKAPLAAIMFDLDHFKHVNDIHGHAKGDEVLATVAAVVRSNVRESDFLGRYGGEEFVVLLPSTSHDGAAMLAEKLRRSIEELEVPDLDRRLSASFGVAAMPRDAVNGEQLLRAADRALYAAKNAGRNRVEVVRASAAGRDETVEDERLDDGLVTGRQARTHAASSQASLRAGTPGAKPS